MQFRKFKDRDKITDRIIFKEMSKIFMLAKDEEMIEVMQSFENTGILEHFPELLAMQNCMQNSKFHPEGNVWVHTVLSVAEATKYRDMIPNNWKLAYMWGVFLHDVGKPASQDLETLSTKGHDKIGVPIAEKFIEKLTHDKGLSRKVCSIVEGHMRPRILAEESTLKRSGWIRLKNICPLDILAYVSVADSDGRGTKLQEGIDTKWFKVTMEAHELLNELENKIPPIVTGLHLIERGMQPSREFGEILSRAYDIQIETGSKDVEEILEKVLKGDKDE